MLHILYVKMCFLQYTIHSAEAETWKGKIINNYVLSAIRIAKVKLWKGKIIKNYVLSTVHNPHCGSVKL